jgi:hypothetical protein
MDYLSSDIVGTPTDTNATMAEQRFVPGLGQPVRNRPSIFIRGPAATVTDRSILSSKGGCYIKDFDRKGSVEKKMLVVSLKGLGAKTN